MRPILRHAFAAGAAVLAGWLAPARALAAERAPDLTLTGTLTGADHETYREVPFRLPAGTVRLTVEFDHTGQAQRSVIDLGLRDPVRFRGWSGGNKARVVVEEADATPSYLPGPLPPGTWRLVLGVPNIRKTATAAYRAKIWFDRADAPFPGFLPAPIKAGPGWYRGDLHMHTAHSDGSCLSRKGSKVPCPVFKTLEAAEARGLDFIAVSDHNATSQNASLRELAPYFDDLLLIPAREVTTFKGHANVYGTTAPLDFQLGSPRAPTLSKILDEVEAAHGLISVNHPGQPSGEICMGCGWNAETDWSRIPALEAINGGALAVFGPEGPLSGIPVWEARLNAGFRITAVGGSDNHDAPAAAGKVSTLGLPATVVHAPELSQVAILTAIRQGHVFVDVWGTQDRLLEVEARAGDRRAEMGDLLPAAAGTKVRVEAHVAGAPEGAVLSLAGDGARLAVAFDPKLGAAEARRAFELTADGQAHWLRVDVRDAKGKLLILGNPIYLRPAT
jgi:hypothetical protein